MPFPKEKETHKNYLGNCHNTHGKTSCYVIGQVWFLISVLWIVINKWLRWNPFQEREFLFQVGAASRRRLEINLPNKTNALWFLYIHFQFFWLIILVLLAFHWRYIVFMVLNLSMIEPKKNQTGVEEEALCILVAEFGEGPVPSSFCLWDNLWTLTRSPIVIEVSVSLAGTDSESI